MNLCAHSLNRRKLPHQVRKRAGCYQPNSDAINVLTMRVGKGLEFPVVMLPGVSRCRLRARMRRKRRASFMWQRRGLRRGW